MSGAKRAVVLKTSRSAAVPTDLIWRLRVEQVSEP